MKAKLRMMLLRIFLYIVSGTIGYFIWSFFERTISPGILLLAIGIICEGIVMLVQERIRKSMQVKREQSNE